MWQICCAERLVFQMIGIYIRGRRFLLYQLFRFSVVLNCTLKVLLLHCDVCQDCVDICKSEGHHERDIVCLTSRTYLCPNGRCSLDSILPIMMKRRVSNQYFWSHSETWIRSCKLMQSTCRDTSICRWLSVLNWIMTQAFADLTDSPI